MSVVLCPFCGHNDVHMGYTHHGAYAVCSKCNASGPIKKNDLEARRAWDVRFAHTPTGELPKPAGHFYHEDICGDEVGPPTPYWGERGVRQAIAMAMAVPAPRPRVHGDRLPRVGEPVLIHLAREDKWVEHEVVGYHVLGDHEHSRHLHRVFVDVEDANGVPNSRMLCDVKHLDGSYFHAPSPLPCDYDVIAWLSQNTVMVDGYPIYRPSGDNNRLTVSSEFRTHIRGFMPVKRHG